MQVLKEEVRERILDAAVQVFYEKDFRSAKLQDIARLADVSASLLYSYFKTRRSYSRASFRLLPSTSTGLHVKKNLSLRIRPLRGTRLPPRDPCSTCWPITSCWLS